MTPANRRELAYWLTLAFRLDREPRRSINGLVLTADRKLHLSLIDLVKLDAHARPAEIASFASTLDHLVSADGKVSAQAFVIDRLLASGCSIIAITDPRYPAHLARRIGPERAPTVLSVMGDEGLWSKPGVAISGSRKSGPAGLAFAREAARAVARAGNTVVCGLAAGVDREALEGALEAGGSVVGIAAEGLLQSHWSRRREIRDGRLAIVSEFAPDDHWSAGRAMARNRTIAGFSNALIIADCVASGGTTDQLEVHRGAGLPVYVRQGPGQGALVEELCRRPGTTPWYWASGPVVWPPADVKPAAGTGDETITVTLSDRLEVHVDVPRQLTLDAVLDKIRVEYRRVSTQAAADDVANREESSTVSEAVAPYGQTPIDPIVAAIVEASAKGVTARDLEESTTTTTYRVRKRLGELIDARLVMKVGRRYYEPKSAPKPSTGGRRKPKPQAPPATEELSLFSQIPGRQRS